MLAKENEVLTGKYGRSQETCREGRWRAEPHAPTCNTSDNDEIVKLT